MAPFRFSARMAKRAWGNFNLRSCRAGMSRTASPMPPGRMTRKEAGSLTVRLAGSGSSSAASRPSQRSSHFNALIFWDRLTSSGENQNMAGTAVSHPLSPFAATDLIVSKRLHYCYQFFATRQPFYINRQAALPDHVFSARSNKLQLLFKL